MGKCPKSIKWLKITFRGPIWVPKGVFLGVLGVVLVYKSGLRILIRAPEVPFLVPPNWLKRPHLANLGVPEMALRVPKSKF